MRKVISYHQQGILACSWKSKPKLASLLELNPADNIIQHRDQNFVDITIQASGSWTKKKDYSNMSKPQMIPSEILMCHDASFKMP
jgi:hypothetical protein